MDSSTKALNFLEIEAKDDDISLMNLLQKVKPVSEEDQTMDSLVSGKPDFRPVFCVKTKDDQERKIFINFCTTEEVEYPKLDLTEDELNSLLRSEMVSVFKIPMLIDTLMTTKDHRGNQNALVCDVLINEEFYSKRIVQSELYRGFLVTVTLEAIEGKNSPINLSLNKNEWVVLKNKKYQVPQRPSVSSIDVSSPPSSSSSAAAASLIDTNPKHKSTLIAEMSTTPSVRKQAMRKPNTDEDVGRKMEVETFNDDDDGNYDGQLKQLEQIQLQETAKRVPRHTLIYNVKNHLLEAQVELPSLRSTTDVSLKLNEDRVLLESKEYNLDIFLPLLMDSTRVEATFNPSMKRLTLRIPVKSIQLTA